MAISNPIMLIVLALSGLAVLGVSVQACTSQGDASQGGTPHEPETKATGTYSFTIRSKAAQLLKNHEEKLC